MISGQAAYRNRLPSAFSAGMVCRHGPATGYPLGAVGGSWVCPCLRSKQCRLFMQFRHPYQTPVNDTSRLGVARRACGQRLAGTRASSCWGGFPGEFPLLADSEERGGAVSVCIYHGGKAGEQCKQRFHA